MIILRNDEKRIIKAYRELRDQFGDGEMDGFCIVNPNNIFSTDWIRRDRIEGLIKHYRRIEDFYAAHILIDLLERNDKNEPLY